MSTENALAMRMAEAITLLRSEPWTLPELGRAVGVHRHTLSKWMAAFHAGGHVRPNGSVKRGRYVSLRWEWVEPRRAV